MKNKKKSYNYLVVFLLFILIYVLLLCALVLFEKGNPASSIHTFADAVWFSLATLSTVGYGDITPVTPMGHVIGVVFLLLSMGVLVALFGSVVSVLTSEGLPMMKLRLMRKKNWYYMAEFTSESDAFAKDILREDKDAVIIYGVNREKEIEKPDYPCLYINVSPARIVAHKKGIGSKCKLFFLVENDIGNNLKAVDVHKLDADVYACTTSGQEKMSGNVHFFHTYDCCARSYWRENPLSNTDDMIVLLGFGNYGMALLERAILTNVSNCDIEVQYHVFGDSRKFRQIHTNLNQIFGINERMPGQDSIYFHEEDWTNAHDIISKADRIIICEDKEDAGWDDLWQIQRYYEYKGRIYLRSSHEQAPRVRYFGTNDQIFTVNQIIRTRLNDAARMMNDLYRRSVTDSLDWDDLGDRLRQSKIAAADHLFMKVRVLLGTGKVQTLDREICMAAYEALLKAKKDPELVDRFRRIEHTRWMRFYSYYNWRYGKKHNGRLREDPKMRRYESLSEDEKKYFDRAWDLLGELTQQMK